MALLLSVAVASMACGSKGAPKGGDQREGVVIAEGKSRPSFVLTDTKGRRFDFAAETKGYPTLLYFGYTSCPDVCPIHFANIAGGLAQLPPELRTRIRVVFVGVDPPRDSPDSIRRWLGHFDASFIGLTGTDEELAAAQSAAEVPLATRGAVGPDGTYAVSHAGWVFGFTSRDEQTWQFPLGVRQSTWTEVLKRMSTGGR